MCGIAGFIDLRRTTARDELQSVAEGMAHACFHRGPDDGGTWVDEVTGVALGHRRLSIVDLSPGGHQPMKSNDGRYIIVFNGEIYNFVELREELQHLGDTFSTNSDTEVMLQSFVRWGVESALKKFVGMFAFALWDAKRQTLYLARDRFGEKPLYYGTQNGLFFFASELKSIRAHPRFVGDIDRNTVALFLRDGYISSPHSIYCCIRKLPPSSYLVVTPLQQPDKIVAKPTFYWSLESVARAGRDDIFNGSDTEAIDELGRVLKQAVCLQMVADVPVGAFLSGGIDSSTVVALMQAQSSRPIRTFTVGFHEQAYNEASYAKSVSRVLGTDHTEIILTPEETWSVIPKLPQIYDEPFADSSQIPTYLVSALARSQVKVSLSGDAADELFGGYNRYVFTRRTWNLLRLCPLPRKKLADLVRSIPLSAWNSLSRLLGPISPASFNHAHFGDKMHKLADVMGTDSAKGLYYELMRFWRRPLEVVKDVNSLPVFVDRTGGFASGVGRLNDFMMFNDTMTYLPDDILVKVDRASMAVSLESRIPFLDHRVAELAWRFPQRLKIARGKGKYILRQLLGRYIPASLIDRPKMGFGLPIGQWLRGPLREWAESLLDVSRLNNQGFFNAGPIQKKWHEHLEGKRQWTYDLWIILMFQAWLDSLTVESNFR